jgi:hypothetical protein
VQRDTYRGIALLGFNTAPPSIIQLWRRCSFSGLSLSRVAYFGQYQAMAPDRAASLPPQFATGRLSIVPN